MILRELQSGTWTHLNAAIAYVKMSGVRHLAAPLLEFANRASVRMTIGIDQQGSSLEGVQTLWLILGGSSSQLFVLQDPDRNPMRTFHPKVWMFCNAERARLVCGSGNLTAGGLYENYEACVVLDCDLDTSLAIEARGALDTWSNVTKPEVIQLTAADMQNLHDTGLLPSEAASTRIQKVVNTARSFYAGAVSAGSGLFLPSGRGRNSPVRPSFPNLPPGPVVPRPVPGAQEGVSPGSPRPRTSRASRGRSRGSALANLPATSPAARHDRLLIEVNARQMTEIYFAKALLIEDPGFFGWPFLGRTKPRRGAIPQPQPDPLPTARVTVFRPDGSIAGQFDDPSLKMWTYSLGPSANEDFRLTLAGGLMSHVVDGSVLVMEREAEDGFDYTIQVYPPGHPEHSQYLARCTRSLPGRGRRYGWE